MKNDMPRPFGTLLDTNHGKLWIGMIFLIIIIGLGIYKTYFSDEPSEPNAETFTDVMQPASKNGSPQQKSSVVGKGNVSTDNAMTSSKPPAKDETRHPMDTYSGKSREQIAKESVEQYGRYGKGFEGAQIRVDGEK